MGSNIVFRRPSKDVVDVLGSTNDTKICKFLLTTYPEYQKLSSDRIYEYPLDEYWSITCSQTFLTMAICYCNIKCLPTILNTCPCFDEFHILLDNELMIDDDDISKCSLRYSLDKSDIHLLVFSQVLSEIFEKYTCQRRMFDLILQLYNIRKH